MSAIVIAEDDLDIRRLMLETLSNAGHLVTAIGDGVAALVAVRHKRPDAVVLDLQMPGMSGLDVLRLLRADPATAHVPVVVVTCHAESHYVNESFHSGADDFLAKPFSLRELTTRIDALLETGRHTAKPSPEPTPAPARPAPRPGPRPGPRPAARPGPRPAPAVQPASPTLDRRGFLGGPPRPTP